LFVVKYLRPCQLQQSLEDNHGRQQLEQLLAVRGQCLLLLSRFAGDERYGRQPNLGFLYLTEPLAPHTEQILTLNWLDTRVSSPTNGDWILSVLGNDYSGGGSTAGSSFLGSWTSYVSANPGATAANSLGRYGVDTTSNKVWAVINHNSEFVVVVPEPSAFALAGLGAALACYAAWRRRTPA
jgi:hypothetical protein